MNGNDGSSVVVITRMMIMMIIKLMIMLLTMMMLMIIAIVILTVDVTIMVIRIDNYINGDRRMVIVMVYPRCEMR